MMNTQVSFQHLWQVLKVLSNGQQFRFGSTSTTMTTTRWSIHTMVNARRLLWRPKNKVCNMPRPEHFHVATSTLWVLRCDHFMYPPTRSWCYAVNSFILFKQCLTPYEHFHVHFDVTYNTRCEHFHLASDTLWTLSCYTFKHLHVTSDSLLMLRCEHFHLICNRL